MHKNLQSALACVSLAAAVALAGCAGMTAQEKGTAIGAGAGAIGGAVLGGGTLGTLEVDPIIKTDRTVV
jgi:osmotically inducible lipoprotein OsmB